MLTTLSYPPVNGVLFRAPLPKSGVILMKEFFEQHGWYLAKSNLFLIRNCKCDSLNSKCLMYLFLFILVFSFCSSGWIISIDLSSGSQIHFSAIKSVLESLWWLFFFWWLLKFWLLYFSSLDFYTILLSVLFPYWYSVSEQTFFTILQFFKHGLLSFPRLFTKLI